MSGFYVTNTIATPNSVFNIDWSGFARSSDVEKAATRVVGAVEKSTEKITGKLGTDIQRGTERIASAVKDGTGKITDTVKQTAPPMLISLHSQRHRQSVQGYGLLQNQPTSLPNALPPIRMNYKQ